MRKLIFILTLSLFANFVNGQIIYDVDWATGGLSQGGQVNLASQCYPPNDTAIICDSFNAGSNWLRFSTKLTDAQCPPASGTKRSEISIFSASLAMTTGVWFYWENMYPTYEAFDPKAEVIWQYQKPVTSPAGSPPLELWVENGLYYVAISFDSTGSNPLTRKIWMSNVIPGQHEQWLVYYKRSIGSDGEIRIWQNQRVVFEQLGANSNKIGGTLEGTGYVKMGIYKWVNGGANPSLFPERVVFSGYWKVGNAAATYEDFYPTPLPPDPTPALVPFPAKLY